MSFIILKVKPLAVILLIVVARVMTIVKANTNNEVMKTIIIILSAYKQLHFSLSLAIYFHKNK